MNEERGTKGSPQTVDKPVYFLRHIKIHGFIFLRKSDFVCDYLVNVEEIVLNHKNRLTRREKKQFYATARAIFLRF